MDQTHHLDQFTGGEDDDPGARAPIRRDRAPCPGPVRERRRGESTVEAREGRSPGEEPSRDPTGEGRVQFGAVELDLCSGDAVASSAEEEDAQLTRAPHLEDLTVPVRVRLDPFAGRPQPDPVDEELVLAGNQ